MRRGPPRGSHAGVHDRLLIEIDREIDRALAAGDQRGAVTLALKGYGQRILLYLRSVLHDGDLADEAFSRFSEKLWRSIGEFRGECTFATWAYRLAWYAAKEIERGLARRRETALVPEHVSRLVQEVRETTAVFLRTGTRDRWAAIRDSLDPTERSLILLRIDRRLAWKDVAAIMTERGTPSGEAALRKRFERLREKLRRLFEEQGLRDRAT
jgi:RNA polymerase sigma-70 factor, ECF subfamily